MARLATLMRVDHADRNAALGTRNPNRAREIAVVAHNGRSRPAAAEHMVYKINRKVDISTLLRRLKNRDESPGPAVRQQERLGRVN